MFVLWVLGISLDLSLICILKNGEPEFWFPFRMMPAVCGFVCIPAFLMTF